MWPKGWKPRALCVRSHRSMASRCRSATPCIACCLKTCHPSAQWKRCCSASPGSNRLQCPDGVRASHGARESCLPPQLVDGNRHRVRQIQAANSRTHRDAQSVLRIELLDDLVRQSGRLAAEDEHIARIESRLEERTCAVGGECEPAACAVAVERFTARREIAMHAHPCILVV